MIALPLTPSLFQTRPTIFNQINYLVKQHLAKFIVIINVAGDGKYQGAGNVQATKHIGLNDGAQDAIMQCSHSGPVIVQVAAQAV